MSSLFYQLTSIYKNGKIKTHNLYKRCKAKKVIVKTNSKSEFNEFVGRVVIVEDNCMPEIKTIENDPIDLQNVIKDFKHDFKVGDSINNGILYPINIYFTIKEYQIVMTKDITNESK